MNKAIDSHSNTTSQPCCKRWFSSGIFNKQIKESRTQKVHRLIRIPDLDVVKRKNFLLAQKFRNSLATPTIWQTYEEKSQKKKENLPFSKSILNEVEVKVYDLGFVVKSAH